jgi:hypothetical protein
MDPIKGFLPAGLGGPVSSRRAAGAGGRFRVADGLSDGQAAGEAGSVAETSLAGLLALQEEAEGGAVRDRARRDGAARRRGRDLLGELAALQRDLLAGGPDPAQLTRLATLAESAPEAADPRLRDVVAAIVLRARIEAARYGV